MNTEKHPDHSQLNTYAFQPEAVELGHVGLHLASCQQCRDEVMLSQRLKASFATIADSPVSAQQQQLVDDFIYREKSSSRAEPLKQAIRDNPLMLKSALHSLSQAIPQSVKHKGARSRAQEVAHQGSFSGFVEWLRQQTFSWSAVGATALVTLTLTILVMQQAGLDSPVTEPVRVASYQDNNQVRFFPRDQLPGIGFFSAAKQSSESYNNIDITFDAKQGLVMNWNPVSNAVEYELNLFRFARGEKELIGTVKTRQTTGLFQLDANDYNQRFEWVLSGQTTDEKTFITTGGFVLQKLKNESRL